MCLLEENTHEGEVRILLAEHHTAVRQAMAFAFEREADFKVVAQAASLSEARGVLEGIEVAVVDLELPDGYGGDLIRELSEVNPQAQALVLGSSLDRGEIARAVEAGAAGVLDKTAHLEEVMEAVRRLRPLLCNCSDQEICQVAQRPTERGVEDLAAGEGGDLGGQPSQ